jgi:hypothetical protein
VQFDRNDTDFFVRHSTGGMKGVLSAKELKEERGVAWELVKQVGSSLLEGRDLVSVSLPVKLFETRSFLQRLASGWRYTPFFLNRAAEISDPLERFKLVIAFALASLSLQVTEKKPFNPIIGETFQANFEDGTEIFLEQTSHHPPKSNWEVFGPNKNYHFWGYGEWAASCTGNTVKGYQKGPNNIDFPDGQRISFSEPVIMIRGIMFGERYIEFGSTMTFVDEKNNLSCDLVLNPDGLGFFKGLFSKAKSPSDTVRGQILLRPADATEKDKGTVLGEITGSWLGYLDIDGVRYWDIRDTPLASQPIPTAEPLMSDSRFRDDLRYLLEGNTELAQEYKTMLEEAQRYDRKLRTKVAELRKKKSGKKAHTPAAPVASPVTSS